MDVEHEDTDFECNSCFNGKLLKLPKSTITTINV